MTFAPLRVLALSALAVAYALASPTSAAAQTKLLRFPDIHGDRVVFTLRRRPVDGAGRRRHGDAADGASGPRAVRQVLAGRQVDRLHRPVRRRRAGLRHAERRAASRGSSRSTRRAGRSRPAGATTTRSTAGRPTARASCSGRTATGGRCRSRRLYTVAATGGPAEPLPMPESGAGDLRARRQADRLLAALPRLPHRRSATAAARPTTCSSSTWPATTPRGSPITRAPIATRCGSATRIYFTSDRDGTLQPLRLRRRERRRRRRSRASRRGTCAGRARTRGGQASSTSSNGELQLLDTKSGKAAAIAITVPDDGLARRPSRIAGRHQIEDFELSPKGERALFAARGDMFTAPIENGPTRNLTRSSGAHDKWPRWSPDGSKHRVHLGPVRRGGDLRSSPRTAPASRSS